MIRPQFFIGCLVVIPAMLSAGSLTQGERDRAMSELHATRKTFLDSVAGLSVAQWNFKPAPDRWSIAECAEHIAKSEDYFFDIATRKMMTSPAAPEKRGQGNARDEEVLKGVEDRSHKAQAPAPLRPTGKLSRQAVVAAFKKSRDHTIDYVEKTPDDLRVHFAPNSQFHDLDAYQMILVIAGDTQRHVEQIREVKTDPRFPKK